MNKKNIFFTMLIIVQMLALAAMDSYSDDDIEIFSRTLPRELHIRTLLESYNIDLGYCHSNCCLPKKSDEIIVNTLSFPSEFLQLNANN